MDNSTFETAAEAIKETVDDLTSDAQKLIKTYPAAALIGAVVIGFAAGRLLRRN